MMGLLSISLAVPVFWDKLRRVTQEEIRSEEQNGVTYDNDSLTRVMDGIRIDEFTSLKETYLFNDIKDIRV
jgi:hypothetical protein